MDEALDLIGGHAALVVLDGDLLLLSGRLLQRRHVQNTVGIDIECDVDLGNTSGHGGNAFKLELAQHVVVLGHRSLSFEDLNQDTGLVVGVSREGLTLLGRHRGVALDEGSHHSTGGFNAEGERSHVKKKQVLRLLGFNAGCVGLVLGFVALGLLD